MSAESKAMEGELWVAAEKGRTEEVERLLAAGADVKEQDQNGQTALHRAAIKGHTETAKALLAAGADIKEKDKYGETTLHDASRQGHTETAKALLAAGAGVKEKNSKGSTALHCASANGHTETAMALLAAGAGIKEKTNAGSTALHLASGGGHTDTVKALLAAGAGVKEKNNSGDTALDTAARRGHAETAKVLQAAGAGIKGKDKYGDTALHLASRNGHTETAKVLRAAKYGRRNVGPTKDLQKGANPDLEKLKRNVNAILNKLTLEKFGPLSTQILELLQEEVKDAETLTTVVAIIFDKALEQAHFSALVAMLCERMDKDMAPVQEVTESGEVSETTFKRVLLNRCQVEFEKGTKTLALEDGEAETARNTRERNQKQRMLGNIRFIGELYKRGLIIEKILHECICLLMPKDNQNLIEEDIEALCSLLISVGHRLDHDEAKRYMEVYMSRVAHVAKSKAVSSRTRFMCMDLVEMRANRWQQRAGAKKAVAEPTTVE